MTHSQKRRTGHYFYEKTAARMRGGVKLCLFQCGVDRVDEAGGFDGAAVDVNLSVLQDQRHRTSAVFQIPDIGEAVFVLPAEHCLIDEGAVADHPGALVPPTQHRRHP